VKLLPCPLRGNGLINSFSSQRISKQQLKVLLETVFIFGRCQGYSLQNKVPRTTGNFSRFTMFPDLHTTFKLPNVHNYVTKVCRQQADVVENYENEHVRRVGQGEARHRKYKKLKLGGGQAYDRSSD
jgi:hypothetical protein